MELDSDAALTILGLSFAIWAGVVAWGVAVIRKEVADMKAAGRETNVALRETNGTMTTHVAQTERRLAMLEVEFRWIKDWMNKHKP